MNKIYLLGALTASLLASLPLYAEEDIDIDDFGLYIGGDLTWSNWDFRMKNNLTFTLPSTLSDQLDFSLTDGDLNGEGRLGGYFLWDDSDFLTAIELFAAGQNAHDSYWGMTRFALNALGQEVSTQWSYGAELKQGYFIEDSWLLFAKLGIIATEFNVKTQFGVRGNENEIYTTHTDEPTLTGVRFGLGLEKFLSEYISIAGQVLYIAYEDYDDGFAQEVTLEGGTGTVTDQVQMDSHAIQFGIGVNVYFL